MTNRTSFSTTSSLHMEAPASCHSFGKRSGLGNCGKTEDCVLQTLSHSCHDGNSSAGGPTRSAACFFNDLSQSSGKHLDSLFLIYGQSSSPVKGLLWIFGFNRVFQEKKVEENQTTEWKSPESCLYETSKKMKSGCCRLITWVVAPGLLSPPPPGKCAIFSWIPLLEC